MDSEILLNNVAPRPSDQSGALSLICSQSDTMFASSPPIRGPESDCRPMASRSWHLCRVRGFHLIFKSEIWKSWIVEKSIWDWSVVARRALCGTQLTHVASHWTTTRTPKQQLLAPPGNISDGKYKPKCAEEQVKSKLYCYELQFMLQIMTYQV